MPNIIGYKDLSNLYIKPAAEPTRTISDIDLKSASEPERVLNPIVSESYMRQYIEEHGGITPTGNIEITENTTEPLDIAPYATATVNVAGGGGIENKLLTLHVVNNTAASIGWDEVFINVSLWQFENDTLDYADLTVAANSSYDLVLVIPATPSLYPVIDFADVIVTDTVNCTVDGHNSLKVTSPDADASCTATLS